MTVRDLSARIALELRRFIWLVFLATLINYIDRLTVSVLAPLITKDLNLSNTEFGGIATWFLFAYTISQSLSGKLYDRIGIKKGFTVSILDLMPGEEAGIKNVSIEIKGQYAYGFLKAEKGVHRLVRISPYDSQARRHTSFASVFVYPDIDDTIEIDLRDEDIKMDVYRASGAGGQHVNKTSSAVRLTHEPTGLVVTCQQERSQFKNKDTAMKMLRAALYQRKLEEQEAAKAIVEATKSDNSWGNQIRSYVFQPYTMVNDHRTELKVSDVQRVMNGDLDEFIEAYLKRFGGKAA